MLIVKNNDQIAEEKRVKQEEADLASNPYANDVASPLVRYVRSCWTQAKTHKRPLERRLTDCYQRRRGIYSQEKTAAIQAANSSGIYLKITGSKCKAIKTWLSDLFEPSGDKPFTFEVANYPDVPPDIAEKIIREAMLAIQQGEVTPQEAADSVEKHQKRIEQELKRIARYRAERMESKIEDTLHQAGWKEEFDDFLDDIATYPFAVISGLEYRVTSELSWVANENGKWSPEYKSKVMPKIRRVSPFRFYPSPSVTNTLKGHWCIELITYPRADLTSLRKTPGYNAEGIAKALLQFQGGGHREWLWSDDERSLINEQSIDIDGDTIDAIRWSGSIGGQQLMEAGVNEVERDEQYQATIEIIGNYIVRIAVSPDPDAAPDYFHASFSSVPGSFAGEAPAELMADCQDMCNAAARAIADNMQFSSGPQVWINTAMMAPGAVIDKVSPRKIWKGMSEEATNASAAIQFFQPQSNVAELNSIFEKFSSIADEVTGLPKFAYGSDRGAGAAKTASGLSMLLNSSSKTVKHVVRAIDINVVEKIAKKAYDHEMLYGDDDSVKGDMKVKAKGSSALMHKESIANQQRELLQATANPIDMQILGLGGRASMLKNVLKVAEVPVDDFPEAHEIEAQQQQQMQQQQQQQMPPQDQS